MAPIKSILMDMAERGIKRKSTYFFGARSKRDLFLLDEMRELERAMPTFAFVPALSEPKPEDAWTGETGLITNVVRNRVTNGANSEAYLCAVRDDRRVREGPQRAGVPEDRIYYDKF
jgi:Na+-transporting NADH:ubiquinone oxidoreductase subunit F